MEKEIKVGLHNRFDFIRRDAKTGEVIAEYRAENIILNNFWSRYLSGNNTTCLRYIHFGSGTTDPLPTDVKLTSWLGYKQSDNVGTGLDFSEYENNGIVAVRKTCRLQDTDFNGSFISEVGFSYDTYSSSGLLTKALVRDMNGNVVSIEKRAGEVLDIFATVFVNFGTNHDNVIYGPISSESYNSFKEFIFSVLFMNSFSTSTYSILSYFSTFSEYLRSYVGTHNSSPECLMRYDNTGNVLYSFDIPQRQLKLTCKNLIASEGNLKGGIRSITILENLIIKVPNSIITQPVIEKEVIGAGDGTTKDFDTKFGWIKNNGTFKVFVNDVEVSASAQFNEPLRVPDKPSMLAVMPVIERPVYNPETKQPITNIGLGYAIGPKPRVASDLTYWYTILENPKFLTHPIESISMLSYYTSAECSDDLVDWVTIGTAGGSGTLSIPAQHGNKRYWKFKQSSLESYTASCVYSVNSPAWEAEKLVHLDTAPGIGDVITVTYQPDCLGKDDKHVLNNLSVTVTFNEYTP